MAKNRLVVWPIFVSQFGRACSNCTTFQRNIVLLASGGHEKWTFQRNIQLQKYEKKNETAKETREKFGMKRKAASPTEEARCWNH